jgi:hypothetical protein
MDPATMMMIAQGVQKMKDKANEPASPAGSGNMMPTQVLGGVQSPTIQPQQPMSPMRQAGMGALQGFAQGGFGSALIGGGLPLVQNYMNNRNEKRLQQQAPPQYYKPTAEDNSPFRRAMMQQLQMQGK